MLSACVISVPLSMPSALAGVRPPRTNCSADTARGSKPSCLPRKVRNSASVMSLVRHSAVAGATSVPAPSNCAGWNGRVQRAASGVSRMSVVVCRSFCACRQTSCLSRVKVTSHSITPAPWAAAARYDSRVCSGNRSGAPRWPSANVVRRTGASTQAASSVLSGPGARPATSATGRASGRGATISPARPASGARRRAGRASNAARETTSLDAWRPECSHRAPRIAIGSRGFLRAVNTVSPRCTVSFNLRARARQGGRHDQGSSGNHRRLGPV